MNSTGLKVLMISSDRNILDKGSAVSMRQKEYGKLVEELHIIVLTTTRNLTAVQISENVWAYPTNTTSKFLYPWSAAKLGKKIVFDKKFVRGNSVITSQDPFECGWAAMKIKNKWRLPLEIQLHTDPFSQYFSGFLNSIRKIISIKVLRSADRLRVVSRGVGDDMLRRHSFLQGKIEILPIPVNSEAIEGGQVTFDLHAKYGWRFILLTVSRLTREKNLELALKILAKVKTQFPSAGLVIVGAGPEECKLRKLCKTLLINDHVAFEGWQNNLASYYKTANAYIQTSLYEGYGLSLIEAAISGLPIITTSVGVAKEFQNGKEAYICPASADFFALAIVDLIENDQKRENLKINMKHTLDNLLLSKEEYLEKLLRGWESTAKLIN